MDVDPEAMMDLDPDPHLAALGAGLPGEPGGARGGGGVTSPAALGAPNRPPCWSLGLGHGVGVGVGVGAGAGGSVRAAPPGVDRGRNRGGRTVWGRGAGGRRGGRGTGRVMTRRPRCCTPLPRGMPIGAAAVAEAGQGGSQRIQHQPFIIRGPGPGRGPGGLSRWTCILGVDYWSGSRSRSRSKGHPQIWS